MGDFTPLSSNVPANFNETVANLTVTGLFYESIKDNIVALAGGGQPGATPLPALLNRIATVATAADSCLLPPAVPGLCISVFNDAAANSANVFPGVGGQTNALAVNAAFALAAGKNVMFCCVVINKWHAILSA